MKGSKDEGGLKFVLLHALHGLALEIKSYPVFFGYEARVWNWKVPGWRVVQVKTSKSFAVC